MVTSEEHLLERFLSLDHGDFGASSEYAAILLHKTLRDQPRIAILGAPGAGKTTLLQYVGLAYAKACAGEKRLRERKCHKRRLSATKWRLPIFVPLGTIAKRLAETLPDGRPPSIVDAVSQTLPPDLEGDIRSFFVDRLKKGRCVVLLDGLDEVPTDEEFRAVVRAIESLAVAYHKNQFIVTSRIAGWRTGIQADFRLTYVSDLTDDQVEFFVDTWCSAVELNSVVGSIKDEKKQIARIESDALTDEQLNLKQRSERIQAFGNWRQIRCSFQSSHWSITVGRPCLRIGANCTRIVARFCWSSGT